MLGLLTAITIGLNAVVLAQVIAPGPAAPGGPNPYGIGPSRVPNFKAFLHLRLEGGEAELALIFDDGRGRVEQVVDGASVHQVSGGHCGSSPASCRTDRISAPLPYALSSHRVRV
jgi:hypothetical protein